MFFHPDFSRSQALMWTHRCVCVHAHALICGFSITFAIFAFTGNNSLKDTKKMSTGSGHVNTTQAMLVKYRKESTIKI